MSLFFSQPDKREINDKEGGEYPCQALRSVSGSCDNL